MKPVACPYYDLDMPQVLAIVSIAHHTRIQQRPVKGSYLATMRICRCHPFHPGGYDPVPEIPTKSDKIGNRQQ